MQDSAEGVPRVADDGFRRDDCFSVRDFRPADFHQLARRIVGVSSHDAVFILFPQGAAAHHLPFRHPAVAARTLNPSVFLVVFVIRRIRQRPGSIRQQGVFLNARVISVSGNVRDFPRAVPRHGLPRYLRFPGLPVEGAVLAGRLIAIDRLHAAGGLLHLQPPPGVFVRRRRQPRFRHFQLLSLRAQRRGAFFHTAHMVGFRIGVMRIRQPGSVHREHHVLVRNIRIGMVGAAVIGVGALPSPARPGFHPDGFTPEGVVRPGLFTSVGGRLPDQFARGVISVSRFTGIVGSISLNTAGAQVAAAALFIGFAHPGNRSAVFPALHGSEEFPNPRRHLLPFTDRVNRVFPFPLGHAPGPSRSLPVAGDVRRAPFRLLRDGELAGLRIALNGEGFKRRPRNGVKTGGNVFGPHLLGQIKGDHIARIRHVLNIGQTVPQVPDLADDIICASDDVQVIGKILSRP